MEDTIETAAQRAQRLYDEIKDELTPKQVRKWLYYPGGERRSYSMSYALLTLSTVTANQRLIGKSKDALDALANSRVAKAGY